MTPFTYSLVLVTIIIGLAIADMLTSLHRLIRARREIRWDWLPLAAALLVLLTILQFWWGFYRLGQIQLWSRYGAFLLLMLQLILMFLLACAALPDEVPDRLELASYYEDNRHYFWTLFAMVAFSALAANFIAGFGRVATTTLLLKTVPNLLYAGLMLSLSFVSSRSYHSAIVTLLLAVMVVGWFPLRLE